MSEPGLRAGQHRRMKSLAQVVVLALLLADLAFIILLYVRPEGHSSIGRSVMAEQPRPVTAAASMGRTQVELTVSEVDNGRDRFIAYFRQRGHPVGNRRVILSLSRVSSRTSHVLHVTMIRRGDGHRVIAGTGGPGAWKIGVSLGKRRALFLLRPPGSGPHGLDATPDGHFVYVANNNANTVSIIATRTRRVVETVHLPGRPNEVALRQRDDLTP